MNIKKRKLKPFVQYAVTLFVIAILVFLIFVIKPWGLFGKKLPKELETSNADAISEIELNDEYEIALYYPEYLPEEYLISLRQEVTDFKEKNTSGRLYIDYKENKNQDFVTTTFSKGLDNAEVGDEIFKKIIHIPSKSEVTLNLLFDKNYLEALAVYSRNDLLDKIGDDSDVRLDIYRNITADESVFNIFNIEGDSIVFEFPFGTSKIPFEKMAYYLKLNVNGVDPVDEPSDKIRYIDPNKPMIALTFDDGPYSPVSNKILDALEEVNGVATFFIVGNRAEYYQDTIKREVEMGCEVGSHTYEHKDLTKLTAEEMRYQFQKVEDAVNAFLPDYKVRALRPVAGAFNNFVKENTPYPMFNWNVDTEDWRYRDADRIYEHIISHVHDGDIVLMHDLYSSTADACVKAIPELVKDYQLVTVLELLEYKGVKPEAGRVYYGVK